MTILPSLQNRPKGKKNETIAQTLSIPISLTDFPLIFHKLIEKISGESIFKPRFYNSAW